MLAPYRRHLPLILLGSLLIGLALAYLGLHLATPFDNGHVAPRSRGVQAVGVQVAPLPAGPTGFESGDIVISAYGRSLEEWARRALTFDWQPPGLRIGEIASYQVLRAGELQRLQVVLVRYPLGQILAAQWGTILFGVLTAVIGLYVLLRRPESAPGRLLFLIGSALFCATTWSLGLQLSDFSSGLGLWLYYLCILPGFMLVWIANLHFALVFPRPLPLTRRRGLLPLMYGLPYALVGLYLLVTGLYAANTLDWMAAWGLPADLTALVYLPLAMAVFVIQSRRAALPAERQQVRWLLLASLLVAGSAVLFYFLPPLLGAPAISANLVGAIGVLFPLAIAVAILRYNLFDIDTLLNRTLVYGTLLALILGLYVLVVTGLGALFQARAGAFPALLATGLAAVLFAPLRTRLQRTVDRLMYGARDEPFEVLAQLGRQLEATISPESVYPAIVETVADALKLPYVALGVREEGQLRLAYEFGRPAADTAAYPLMYQGREVGQLLVAPRAPDEPLGEADEKILRSTARQAGAAVHAVQLTADLQRSRQELVTSREEERRRLRRDLHDGLGPTLAALQLQAGVLRRQIQTQPQAAEALAVEILADLNTAIEDLRRVVYALRPPVLDSLGLAGAVRALARRGSAEVNNDDPGAVPQVQVEAPESLPPLPAAVEVAAYRIVQEALTNVWHHAAAENCQVRLEVVAVRGRRALLVEIADDGVGLPAGPAEGLGLLSMRERAEELGGRCRVEAAPQGGTRVRAWLPIKTDKS